MATRKPKRRTRAPDLTRERLLTAAFEEIHRRGFQAASIDAILARAGVTKGALYHHFPDKAALGYAVMDEVLAGIMLHEILGPLEQVADDPVSALQAVVDRRGEAVEEAGVELGCPLNNLAQEMTPVDERFRRRVAAMFDTWIDAFAGALERGQAEGTVRRDVDARKVAAFVVAAVEGSIGVAKSAKSLPALRSNLQVLKTFLDGLRVAPVKGAKRRRLPPKRA